MNLSDPYHDELGRPIQPLPPAPTPEISDRTARRREAARKGAATAAARRQQKKVDQLVEQSLDRIATRANDPPGTPTAPDLIRTAQAEGAEAELYRLAHIARAPWKPSDWPAETRTRLGEALAEHFRTRKAPRTKGPAR